MSAKIKQSSLDDVNRLRNIMRRKHMLNSVAYYLSESLFSETPSEIGVWAQFMVPILLDSVPIKSDSHG